MADTRNFGPKHYNSFSGADIRAVFANKEIGELQAISYAVQREKAPIYTMGRVNPRAFSRGKRGIAGSLVFIMFDEAALINELGILAGHDAPEFLSSNDEPRPIVSDDPTNPIDIDTLDSDSPLVGDTGSVDFSASYTLSPAWYADQIPPFDVTITAANEYGAAMIMRIIGVEIINEGYGVSVDDMNSEQQMTYVARAIHPWQASTHWNQLYTGGQMTVVPATGP